MAKRCFDITLSALGMLFLWPLFGLLVLLVWATSKRPVFFTQARVGLNGRPFSLYKFRTMTGHKSPSLVTTAADDRVTPIGRWLRRYKLDELPQLLNVLKGDMSLVGPRPEVPKYVAHYKDDYAKILTVRPGITDLASIRFKNESALLTSAEAEKVYITSILPLKIKYNLEYVENRTLLRDIVLLAKTLAALWGRHEESTIQP